MKQFYKIDSEGYYIEPVIFYEDVEKSSDCIESPPPSFYKAKWQGGKWIETGHAPEAVVPPPTIEERMEKMQQENTELKSSVMMLEDIVMMLTTSQL